MLYCRVLIKASTEHTVRRMSISCRGFAEPIGLFGKPDGEHGFTIKWKWKRFSGESMQNIKNRFGQIV